MSRRRLNTILKLAANTSEENVNTMPTLVTSPQNKDVPVDLPILTYEATLLSYDFFSNYKSHQVYNSIRPGRAKDDLEVKDLRAIQYNPESQRIFYKLMFDEPYTVLPIGRKCDKINPDVQYDKLYKKPIPINLSKWQDLQKLKKFLPQDTYPFYDNLSHSDTYKSRNGNI